VIELKHISLEFSRPVLKEVNLTLVPGEILGIVGKSGAGKSSLMAVLAGKLTPQIGDVIYNGKILPPANQLLIPGYPFVQLVEQQFALDLYHTVFENIHLKASHLAFDKRDSWVNKLIGILGLKKVINQQAITLSGGEQQRLAIARALATKPLILLLDEPFAHLDELLKSKLQRHLLKINQETNCSIVLVSHDGMDLLSVSDSIIQLKNGRISKKRKPQEIYFNPKNKEEAELFGPWNRIEINGELKTFRPNQYKLVPSGGLEIQSVEALFKGSFFENKCMVGNKPVILHSNQPLQKGIQFIFNA